MLFYSSFLFFIRQHIVGLCLLTGLVTSFIVNVIVEIVGFKHIDVLRFFPLCSSFLHSLRLNIYWNSILMYPLAF